MRSFSKYNLSSSVCMHETAFVRPTKQSPDSYRVVSLVRIQNEMLKTDVESYRNQIRNLNNTISTMKIEADILGVRACRVGCMLGTKVWPPGGGGDSAGPRTPTTPPPPLGAFGQQLVAKGVALRRPRAPKAPDAP